MSVLEVPSQTRREWIDAYVKRSRFAKLAPLVEWMADLLDWRAGIRDPILERIAARLDRRAGIRNEDPSLRAPPPAGAVGLFRPTTRKVLAFDLGRTWGTTTSILVFVFPMVWALVHALEEAIRLRGLRGVLPLGMFLFVGIVWFFGFTLVLARRVCWCRRVLARCVVVTARIVATEGAAGWSGSAGQPMWVHLEYTHDGELYRSKISCWAADQRLLGSAPEILVDTEMPTQVLFRDLCV